LPYQEAVPRCLNDPSAVVELEAPRDSVHVLPTQELSVRGKAGLRASHDVQLVVTGFRAEPGAAAQ